MKKLIFTILGVLIFTFMYSQEYEKVGIKNVTSSIKSTDCGNVALSSNGATASAISEGTYQGNTQYAYYANDGNSNTGWSSQWDMPAWLKIELDQVYNINAIGIWWGSHQHTFSVSLSLDGNNWTTVVSSQLSNNSEGSAPVYQLYSISSTDAKYMKIDITTTSAPSSHIFQATVHEFEAYTNPLPNVALSTYGGTASAISEGTYQGNTQYAYYSNDGNENTGWSSQWDMPAWLKIEFNQIKPIDVIGIWWGSHQHTFSVSLSVDGNNWTTVVPSQLSINYEGASPMHQQFSINRTDAKFVKIDLTTTSAPSSHIFQATVHELQAFSEDCPTVGINESSSNELVKVYPIPATDQINIEIIANSFSSFDVRIYDIQGKLVLTNTDFKKSTKINIENLTKGVYFLKINDKDFNVIKTEKIIVE